MSKPIRVAIPAHMLTDEEIALIMAAEIPPDASTLGEAVERIEVAHPQRREMPAIAGQQHQIMDDRGGGDGDVGETRMPADRDRLVR